MSLAAQQIKEARGMVRTVSIPARVVCEWTSSQSFVTQSQLSNHDYASQVWAG